MAKRTESKLEIDNDKKEMKLLCQCGRDHTISGDAKDTKLTTDEKGIESDGKVKEGDKGNTEKPFINRFFES